MARNKQNYVPGDVFVPQTTFPSASAKAQGPEMPGISDPGGSIQIVQHGTAYGGVYERDAARDMSKVRMKKYDMKTFRGGIGDFTVDTGKVGNG
jgi:hypothetical protein